MRITFTTRSGSKYVIDKTAMTWERQAAGEGSVYVRTQGGTLLQWPTVIVGSPVEIIGPPLDPAADIRFILTTPIVSVVEEP